MGFFSNLISSAVKTVITPVAVVKDVVNVAIGQEANATKEHIESAVKDVGKSLDDLADGDL